MNFYNISKKFVNFFEKFVNFFDNVLFVSLLQRWVAKGENWGFECAALWAGWAFEGVF